MRTKIQTVIFLCALPISLALTGCGPDEIAQVSTLSPAEIRAIRTRLDGLIADSDDAQFKEASSLPEDRSFTVGEYPAWIDFLEASPDGLHLLIDDVLDASGSSIMGLWFLSQAHRILGEIGLFDATALRRRIRTQIERASLVPQFFQGTSEDVLGCPPETMGWYPLVGGYRLPSLLPDLVVDLLPASVLRDLGNLSDGDIWAWCMAIDDSTPGILRYHHPITAPDIYAPLLGSRMEWTSIGPHERDLVEKVRGTGGDFRLPIGTFYGTSEEKYQRISCVVIANILASIPLLDQVPAAYAQDLENAASFVREATAQALRGEVAWKDMAYDYYTIPVAAIAYIARAHKRITEIGRPGYPELLDDRTVAAAVDYISEQAERAMANPDLYRPEGAKDYATLVYCFSGMMNLRFTDPELFDRGLCQRTMRSLLTPNRDAYRVAGTGPYLIFEPIWADMASICFIVPPLVEALTLYLQIEAGGAAAAPGLGHGSALPSEAVPGHVG